MNARHKLNAAYVNGTLLVAGTLGLVTQSWALFGVALVIGLALDYWAGNIRPSSRRPS